MNNYNIYFWLFTHCCCGFCTVIAYKLWNKWLLCDPICILGLSLKLWILTSAIAACLYRVQSFRQLSKYFAHINKSSPCKPETSSIIIPIFTDGRARVPTRKVGPALCLHRCQAQLPGSQLMPGLLQGYTARLPSSNVKHRVFMEVI